MQLLHSKQRSAQSAKTATAIKKPTYYPFQVLGYIKETSPEMLSNSSEINLTSLLQKADEACF